MANIYKILEAFNRIESPIKESQNADQQRVKQLPALFNPKNISPVLGQEPKDHPTKEYFVGGESINDDRESVEDAVERAILHRIMMQHTGLLSKFGPEAVMNAAREVADFVGDVDEIGTSDVSGWVRQVERDLTSQEVKEESCNECGYTMESCQCHETVSESVTSEDVISKVTKKLGDYLKNIEDEIKSDPDLKDKAGMEVDNIGPAVKTITTHDGHEIKIHGNQDDGFRITIKNKPHPAKFDDLDHATMACEMYCNHRQAQRAVEDSADYLEEK
jgi:hypothetical protein